MGHEKPGSPPEPREAEVSSDEAVALLLNSPEQYIEQRERELAGTGAPATSGATAYGT